MNVYVESNFVLELALLQEQHESCKKVIELAETNKIKLIIPAYSLIEPFETIIRNAKTRSKTANDLAKELNQLSRSKPYHEEMHAFQRITGFLVRSQEEEKERLRETVNKLLNVSTIIPLDTQILISAGVYQIRHDLSPQDSIVYASVVHHLKTTETTAKCLLNRNSKDFDDPDIETELAN